MEPYSITYSFGMPLNPAPKTKNPYDEDLDTISIEWSVDDVLSMRPDLSLEQAREVLHRIESNHDASIGINWDVIQITADLMFDEQTECLHSFNLGDVEDPHLYAQMAISDWAADHEIKETLSYTLMRDEYSYGGWKVRVHASED